MKETQFKQDRGQTNLDFATGFLIFIVFVTSTFFLGGSPLVDASGENVYLQSQSEQALVQILDNEISTETGEYTYTQLENIENEPLDEIHIDDGLNASLNLSVPDGSEPPAAFDNTTHVISAGDSTSNVPSAGIYTTNSTIRVDGRPVRVAVSVWRNTGD